MKYAFLLLLFVFSTQALSSPLPDFPFVTVTGEQTEKVAPNIVDVNVSVTTFDKSSEQAEQLFTATTQKVLEQLGKFDIPTDSITASNINKQTKRNRDDNYQDLEILGYEFSRTIMIKIEDLSIYSGLMQALMEIDNVEDLRSKFDHSDREKIETRLLGEAAVVARNKAMQMAKGLNVKLGKVHGFNDSGSFNTFFATFGLENRYISRAHKVMVSGSRNLAQFFIPKTIDISKTINVIYRLEE